MDPKLLMELTELIQRLPPAQLQRMQTLMHNMMAGFDVRKDLEEFEKSLPPGFREKLLSIWARQAATETQAGAGAASTPPPSAAIQSEERTETTAAQMGLRDARLTILRAVADGQMSPEEAEHLLFGAQSQLG